MKHNPVGWFEIYVQDIERAKKFYESVFQCTLDKLNSPGIEMWGFPMEPTRWGAGGSLVKMDGVPSGGNSILVYFSCDDCASEESRAEQAGRAACRHFTQRITGGADRAWQARLQLGPQQYLLGKDQGLGDAVFGQFFRVDRSSRVGDAGQHPGQHRAQFTGDAGLHLLPVLGTLAALAAEEEGEAHVQASPSSSAKKSVMPSRSALPPGLRRRAMKSRSMASACARQSAASTPPAARKSAAARRP